FFIENTYCVAVIQGKHDFDFIIENGSQVGRSKMLVADETLYIRKNNAKRFIPRANSVIFTASQLKGQASTCH
ncbi:hypothetical protein, partial [Vibrio genomosp. F10]|uniref:hypothetical protein n=1 Tax=Vibrio genomosp. F10 TaxID=723171 RepID=UPI001969AD7D